MKKRAELLDEVKVLIIDAKNVVSGAEFTQKLDATLEELKAPVAQLDRALDSGRERTVSLSLHKTK